MNDVMDQMKLDSVVSTSSGKTARELEIELQNTKKLLIQEERELEQEREISRLLREKIVAEKSDLERIRKELCDRAEKFECESRMAQKSLNASIRAYKDAMVSAVNDNDYLQYCKTVQIDNEHTAYDFVIRLKRMYQQHEASRQDRLVALEAKARRQRSAAMASANRIMSGENPKRVTFFDFEDENTPQSEDLNLRI